MKQLFAILTFGLLIFSQTQATAQRDNDDRWERFRNEKVAFFTTNLDLTPQEAQKFWPVYNQFEKERSAYERKRHDLEIKARDAAEKLSEREMIQLTRDHVELSKAEAELEGKYNEEFLKILPPLKVIKLYNAENEFRMYLMRKYRDRNRGDRDDRDNG